MVGGGRDYGPDLSRCRRRNVLGNPGERGGGKRNQRVENKGTLYCVGLSEAARAPGWRRGVKESETKGGRERRKSGTARSSRRPSSPSRKQKELDTETKRKNAHNLEGSPGKWSDRGKSRGEGEGGVLCKAEKGKQGKRETALSTVRTAVAASAGEHGRGVKESPGDGAQEKRRLCTEGHSCSGRRRRSKKRSAGRAETGAK